MAPFSAARATHGGCVSLRVRRGGFHRDVTSAKAYVEMALLYRWRDCASRQLLGASRPIADIAKPTFMTHRRHPGGGKKQAVVRSNDAVCPDAALSPVRTIVSRSKDFVCPQQKGGTAMKLNLTLVIAGSLACAAPWQP
jgi:hypothetical protein